MNDETGTYSGRIDNAMLTELRASRAKLRADNRRLRAALQGLLTDEINVLEYNPAEEWWLCNYCASVIRQRVIRLDGTTEIVHSPHSDDCAWEIARKALEGDKA